MLCDETDSYLFRFCSNCVTLTRVVAYENFHFCSNLFSLDVFHLNCLSWHAFLSNQCAIPVGGSLLKKQMLDDRRFPKMHLDLQRLLQVFLLILLMVKSAF